jgi:hypothetical protein
MTAEDTVGAPTCFLTKLYTSRVKTKFWGKSMEFQPEGVVRVELKLGGDAAPEVYEWNKESHSTIY